MIPGMNSNADDFFIWSVIKKITMIDKKYVHEILKYVDIPWNDLEYEK